MILAVTPRFSMAMGLACWRLRSLWFEYNLTSAGVDLADGVQFH